MKLREEYTCPLELTHDITKGKWKPIILWQLGKCKMSLSQLERDIKGINQKMLSEQLKELMDFGVIKKESFEGYPLKVEYSLTERGHKLDCQQLSRQLFKGNHSILHRCQIS